MTGSDDDRMDEMLVQGARDYNAPGPVPREEMWAAIAAARQKARTTNLANVAEAPPVPRDTKRSIWFGPGIGIAAALLLTTGIVIGRRMTSDTSVAPATQTKAQSTAQSNAQPSAPAGPPANASTVASTAGSRAPGSSEDTLIRQLREETHKTDARVRALAEASSPAASDGAPPTSAGSAAHADPRRTNTLALQLVVMRHLAGSEAMITSFRSTARRNERDPMMAEWSQELLSTTRTLEASRAADDPVMKRLLDDLDLVISQIVQYTTKGTNNPDELDLIEQSINRRGVITKLRSTLPARPMPAGL